MADLENELEELSQNNTEKVGEEAKNDRNDVVVKIGLVGDAQVLYFL